MRTMKMARAGAIATGLAMIAIVAAGCSVSSRTGRFEKVLTVSGPVRLELQNRSGSVEIRTGAANEVRVQGEYRWRGWGGASAKRRFEELEKDPPVDQQGNWVRVGTDWSQDRRLTIEYVVTVPEDTEVQARTGSGRIEVRGVKQRAELSTGSGSIRADRIGGDVKATTGSGRIEVMGTNGNATLRTGSGSITVTDVTGSVDAETGSGGISVIRPGRRVEVRTGSGSIQVDGAKDDLWARTGSGSMQIEGTPGQTTRWELRTGSGSIRIDVPENASFRIYARTSSGRIRPNLPLVQDETGRRLLRAHTGNGGAWIEAETSSGSITIE